MKNFKKELNALDENRQISRQLQKVIDTLIDMQERYNINNDIEFFIIKAISQLRLVKTTNDLKGNKLFNELYNNIFK